MRYVLLIMLIMACRYLRTRLFFRSFLFSGNQVPEFLGYFSPAIAYSPDWIFL